ncbi:MAG: hypothetical protein GY950_26880 [bacterium]|nr:hypothetical protein [bacterium]
MQPLEIRELIRENKSLFWYIKEDALESISTEFLVETILHYGNETSVKKLFDLVGIRKVADIFYKQISGNRVNYPPRTVHFFDLYFKKNA